MREVWLDGVQCLFERHLVGDFAAHQKAQRVLDAWVVGDVDQPFIDDLGPRLGGNVRTQVGSGFANGIDVGSVPRYAGGIDQRRPGPIQQAGDM
ncbi:hypothetical protein D3C75_1091870 [compost metagenome]